MIVVSPRALVRCKASGSVIELGSIPACSILLQSLFTLFSAPGLSNKTSAASDADETPMDISAPPHPVVKPNVTMDGAVDASGDLKIANDAMDVNQVQNPRPDEYRFSDKCADWS